MFIKTLKLFHMIIRDIERIPRKVYYGLMLAKKGGLDTFLRQPWSRAYSKTTYAWLDNDLDSIVSPSSPPILLIYC
jgi:hypothetical protein